ncbi:MAG: hypothetical protein AMJ90_00395 [candidate division Zixibacteria bacterium SM23_73_2]|nr:MAG: hypothetical protein AMJ90_00395 [candidate division Zixibacteria bacterium SM23_73_2]
MRSLIIWFTFLLLLCFLIIAMPHKFYLVGIVLFGLSFLLVLNHWLKLNVASILVLSILYSAPLEIMYWKIGFALRPIILVTLLGFYFVVLKYLLEGLRAHIKTKRLFILCYLLICTFLLSYFGALEPIRSIRVTILYITLFMLLFLIIQLIKEKKEFKVYLKHYMIIGVLLSLYGILQFLGWTFGFDFYGLLLSKFRSNMYNIFMLSTLGTQVFRINSFFTDCNNFAAFLNTVFPLFLAGNLYYFSIRKSKQFWIYFLGAFIVGITLILTFSRSGWMGLLAGVSVVMWDKRKQIFKAKNLRAIVLTILLLLLLIIPFYNYLSYSIEYRLVEKVSSKIHFFVMKAAWDMFLSNPITGVGIGNFGAYYGRYINPGFDYYNPHSTYLAILSETGILGFIVHMAIYLFVLKQILCFKRKTKGYESEVLGTGLLAGFVALMVANIFYQNYTFQFFFVFLGLGFVSGLVAEQKD